MNILNFVVESTVDDSDEDITYTPAISFDSVFCVSNEMESVENKAGSFLEDLSTSSATKMTIDNCNIFSGSEKKKKSPM